MERSDRGVSGSLRDRQKEAVRHEVRDAALKLFWTKGFSATSVDEIARRAGISRSTFFRYFGSKDAILAEQTEENAALFLRLLAARPTNEGRMAALENALVDMTEAVRTDERRDELLVVQQVIQSDESLRSGQAAVSARHREDVARVLAERDGRSEPNLEDSLASAILGQITEHAGERWSSAGFDAPVAELIRSYFETVRRVVAG